MDGIFVGLQDISFNHPVGPKNTFQNVTTVGEIFQILWKGISEEIVLETNIRGRNDDNEMEENISLNDVNLMLASLLVMGLNVQPQIADYFAQSETKGIFGCNWLIERFTQKKWSALHAHIHFKHKELISKLRTNFQDNWNLYRELVVDEMIIPFTGKWKHIQHVRNKPHNTGLKIYCLADYSRYLWDFWLFEGDESERDSKPDEIVKGFVNSVISKQDRKTHIMVTDSYYSSLHLAEWLHAAKWGALLSCKADRPSFLFSWSFHPGIEKYDVVSLRNRNFSALTYFDKAKVNIITNLFEGEEFVKDSNDRILPRAIYQYRQWLGNIDHFDRWIHLYLQKHRNIKWTQALLCALLKMAVNNTLIIASEKNINHSIREVTLAVIDHLAQDYSLRKQRRSTEARRVSGNDHFPELTQQNRRCVYCYLNGVESKTTYQCTSCKQYIHPKCWILYHSVEN